MKNFKEFWEQSIDCTGLTKEAIGEMIKKYEVEKHNERVWDLIKAHISCAGLHMMATNCDSNPKTYLEILEGIVTEFEEHIAKKQTDAVNLDHAAQEEIQPPPED